MSLESWQVGDARRVHGKPLVGTVALVAGARRGMGRAIACRLGEAGATVYCTGSGRRRTVGYQAGESETIEKTADLVDRAGGKGISVLVDHRVNAQVLRLVARVRDDEGRLDVLVNVFDPQLSLPPWGRFWLQARHEAHTLWRAVWPHVVTCEHVLPLMMECGPGLIVELTSRDKGFDLEPLFSDLGRIAQIRFAAALAREIAPHGLTALAVTPGRLLAELVGADVKRPGSAWPGAAGELNVTASEMPDFVGRVVVALATDPRVHRKSGGLYSTWTLAREYRLALGEHGRPFLAGDVSEPSHAAAPTPGGQVR